MEILPDSPKDPLSTLHHIIDGGKKRGDSFSIISYYANSFMLEVGGWGVVTLDSRNSAEFLKVGEAHNASYHTLLA